MKQNILQLFVLLVGMIIGIQTSIIGMLEKRKSGTAEYFNTITANLKNNENNVLISLKNTSVGLMGETYDIYAQIVPSMYASRISYEEIFIPYNETKLIGKLSSMDDIRVRGNSALSPWAYNRAVLDDYRKEVNKWTSAEYCLTLTVMTSAFRFYIESDMPTHK